MPNKKKTCKKCKACGTSIRKFTKTFDWKGREYHKKCWFALDYIMTEEERRKDIEESVKSLIANSKRSAFDDYRYF